MRNVRSEPDSNGQEELDRHWMQQALQQAKKAAAKGEVPVGAVLIDADNRLLAAGHNQPIGACDPTAHAEITVLREAARQVNNYRLVDSTLYVTLEPCVMCVGALIHARVRRVVYGAPEPKTGGIVSVCRLLDDYRFNHRPEIMGGVLEAECEGMISDFFAGRRQQIKMQRNESADA